MPLSVSFAIRCQPRGVTLPLRRPSRGGLQGCSLDPCRLGCIDIVKQPSNLQIFNQVSGFNTSYGVVFHRISNCPTSCDAFPNRIPAPLSESPKTHLSSTNIGLLVAPVQSGADILAFDGPNIGEKRSCGNPLQHGEVRSNLSLAHASRGRDFQSLGRLPYDIRSLFPPLYPQMVLLLDQSPDFQGPLCVLHYY